MAKRDTVRSHVCRFALVFFGINLLAVVLAGCALGTAVPQAPTTHGPTAMPGGLSQDAAAARALHLAPASSSTPTVVWASIESDPFVPQGSVPGRLVWIVRLEGGLAASPCPSGFLDRAATASDPACLDAAGGADVVLDYFTGNLLGWVH